MSRLFNTAAIAVLLVSATGNAQPNPGKTNDVIETSSGPVKVEHLAALSEPWGMTFLPDGRMLVTEKPGRLRIYFDGKLSEPVRGVPKVTYKDQGGLQDVEIDPDFAQNGLVYFYFVEASEKKPKEQSDTRDPRVGDGQDLKDLTLKGGAVARGRLDGNQLRDVKVIDISNTEITDVGPLRLWKNLVVVKANNTKIQNIDPLASLPALQKLYVDDTGINDLHVQEFLARKPDVLVVYKTYHVQRWWSRLPDGWKTVFKRSIKNESDTEELHRLVEMKSITVSDAAVSELGSLSEFVQLQELHFSGTAISDLSPLTQFNGLKSLHATNSPVKDLEPIGRMTSIEDLDISGTPVSDLKEIRELVNLKKINCSGTEVRKLDALEHMTYLEFVDCSNTSVGDLDPIAAHPLKQVKCFNSRVSKRGAEKLKAKGVEVVFY